MAKRLECERVRREEQRTTRGVDCGREAVRENTQAAASDIMQ